jgi:hypothetical protein
MLLKNLRTDHTYYISVTICDKQLLQLGQHDKIKGLFWKIKVWCDKQKTHELQQLKMSVIKNLMMVCKQKGNKCLWKIENKKLYTIEQVCDIYVKIIKMQYYLLCFILV